MTMNTSPSKNEPAKPTGRRYASVSELLLKESVHEEIRKGVASLNAETVIVRRLVALRAGAGMTQSNLAKKLGCTQSRISKIEASKDEDITLGVIRDYVQATESRIGIFCGKPVSHVEAVKNHALSIRRHLESLADIAQKHDELEPHIQGFFGEAFFNILSILSECQNQMPNGRGDFELRLTSELEVPHSASSHSEEALHG